MEYYSVILSGLDTKPSPSTFLKIHNQNLRAPVELYNPNPLFKLLIFL